MEVNVKEARKKISALLDLTQKGEEILISRRGKKVARLVPVADAQKRLPDFKCFQGVHCCKGRPCEPGGH